ncbi:MAG: TonB-dependent receptor [Candidatus Marinimicrobia bacterium]|nr:TonB-dependent receptor [Candidatus Neomarinimicrobiota bacterium]
MKGRFRFLVFMVFVLALAGRLFPAVTGKIAGYIRDAETGQPLPAVNVILKGTYLGAATDENGYYVILNVPPGKYTLKAMMIGYSTVIIKDVEVVMNLTTTINIDMKREAIGLKEVVAVARRPVVVKDISNSQLDIDAGKISSLPVTDVTEVIGLQAGVSGLTIRGGSSRQTAFIVDGFIMNDERSNVPYTSLSLSTVKEVQVQTGGFNAEYGNIRSGVINIVTKDPGRENYTGSFFCQYRPPGPKHFGPSVYDPYTFFTRPYLDPEVCWFGVQNSDWDEWERKQYPNFEGWVSISEATLRDDDPSNDLTPTAAKRIFEWQHRRQGDIKKPDYVVDGSFGGPVPGIGEKFGGLRFFASYRDLREMFIFPLSRDCYREFVGRLKLVSDITPKMKLTLNGMYGEIHSVSPYNWTTTPTGRVLRSDYEIADLVSSSSGNSIIYMPGWFSPTAIYRTVFGFKLNRVVSSRTFYEVVFQVNTNRYKTYQMTLRDTTKKHEIFPGYFVDEAPYGYWGYGVTGIDGMRIGGWMNLGRDRSVISTAQLKFDITSQLNPTNQFKSGFHVVYNDYSIRSYTENPSMTTWNREQIYRVYPYRIGVYVQDKMEFEGFIANVGLRLDYSDPNVKWYRLETYDKYYREGFGKLLEEEVERYRPKPQMCLSPRLGVSHPITENSKLYFNYGHFRMEPSSTYRFRLQREYNGLVTSIGNPELKLERTIAYELGYSHNLFNQVLLNVAAYYKDITYQIGWVNYRNINNSVQYAKPENNNYEDIRGFEITLDKKVGRWVTGFVNYTYMVRTYGYFGYQWYYEDPNLQREYLRMNPTLQRPSPQKYIRANIDFHTPLKFGPQLAGLYPVGGININLLARWTSGAYTTYNPENIPGVMNNVRWKDTYYVDLRFTKTFKVKRYQIQFFVDVKNLFNFKFLSYAGFSDYYDYLDYMNSLHFSWEEGIEKGSDRVGEYRDYDVGYVPMRSVEDINTVPNPSSRVLYYEQETGRYLQYADGQWVERSRSWVKKNILDTKAYIDMPNLRYFAFLHPRDIKFGIKISF